MNSKLRKVEYNSTVISNIKKMYKGLKPEEVNIFFDMDNTLFIFSIGSNDLKSLEEQNNFGFFSGLRPMNNAVETLWKLHTMGYKLHSLSACSVSHAEKEKNESLDKHFPFITKENRIFVKNGENKADKIKSMGFDINKSILVDDYYVNLMNWLEAGGLAIKKTFSGKNRIIPQVKEFEELPNILFNILQ